MNRTVLVGRLTRDPELKKTSSGGSVSNFTVAINRTYKNADGEQEADFINCVAWGKTAENLVSYQSKGNLIGVDGRIQTRTYDNANGQKVYVTEVFADNVQFLESKASNQAVQQQTAQSQANSAQSQNGASNDFFSDFSNNNSNDILSGLDISDEELPF